MTQASLMTQSPLMTQSAQSDQDLVAAARDGDDRAFEELYGRYRRKISAFALRLTRDPDRADDITQEVFISALRRLRNSDRPISFRPWIYEIARNACIDEYRRSRRNQEIPIERDGVDSWLAALATAPPPEVAVESRQQLDDLCGAFRGLSERHHKIIVLRELEGLSYSQIGDRLGMSKMVVESTLFRARRRLTEEYEDLSSGRRCQHVRALLAKRCDQPVRQLGLREHRALSRHIEHCQPCRREALAAGIAGELHSHHSVQKVAAFLPLPMLPVLRRAAARLLGVVRGAQHAAIGVGSSAGSCVAPLASAATSERLAATAATLVLAAFGGGVVGVVATGGDHHAARAASPAIRLAGVTNSARRGSADGRGGLPASAPGHAHARTAAASRAAQRVNSVDSPANARPDRLDGALGTGHNRSSTDPDGWAAGTRSATDRPAPRQGGRAGATGLAAGAKVATPELSSPSLPPVSLPGGPGLPASPGTQSVTTISARAASSPPVPGGPAMGY